MEGTIHADLSWKKCIWRCRHWKICVYQKGEQTVKRTHIADTEQEKKRFDTAVQTAIEQLGELYEKAVKEVGEDHAAIFEIPSDDAGG